VKRKEAKYHVDVFPVTETVFLDDDVIFADGAWRA
jgi:aminopeptidase